MNVMNPSFSTITLPVSILPSVSNVFDRIMYNRFISYLNEYKICFPINLVSEKHIQPIWLMTLIDKLTKCLDSDEYIIGVFLDFSNDFDTEDHVVLLKKSSVNGVRGNALSSCESYLKKDGNLLLIMVYYLIL